MEPAPGAGPATFAERAARLHAGLGGPGGWQVDGSRHHSTGAAKGKQAVAAAPGPPEAGPAKIPHRDLVVGAEGEPEGEDFNPSDAFCSALDREEEEDAIDRQAAATYHGTGPDDAGPEVRYVLDEAEAEAAAGGGGRGMTPGALAGVFASHGLGEKKRGEKRVRFREPPETSRGRPSGQGGHSKADRKAPRGRTGRNAGRRPGGGVPDYLMRPDRYRCYSLEDDPIDVGKKPKKGPAPYDNLALPHRENVPTSWDHTKHIVGGTERAAGAEDSRAMTFIPRKGKAAGKGKGKGAAGGQEGKSRLLSFDDDDDGE